MLNFPSIGQNACPLTASTIVCGIRSHSIYNEIKKHCFNVKMYNIIFCWQEVMFFYLNGSRYMAIHIENM